MNLSSPQLVKVFDVKKSADGDYFEFISGPTLRDMLISDMRSRALHDRIAGTLAVRSIE